MDRRCNTCRNSSSFKFCWFHNQRRRCVMARDDSAEYAFTQEGHLHSPLCRFCQDQPAVITCHRDRSIICYHCFLLHGTGCVMQNHEVLVIPFSSHVSCCNEAEQANFPQGVGIPVYRPPPQFQPRPPHPQPRPPQPQSGLNLDFQLGPPAGGPSAGTRGRSDKTQQLPLSTDGLKGPDRVLVGGLPYNLTEDQIRELLESVAPLRAFKLVKDRETGNSMGYAFCVFQDPSVTDVACAALDGIEMGNKKLTVRRANKGAVQPKPDQEDRLLHAKQQIALQSVMLQPGVTPTKIVCLTQVVSADDNEEYEDIVEDMRQEGGKFGNLVNVVIPRRPDPDHDPTPGVGKVFFEYADVDGAEKAISGMNGRKFRGNQVVAVYYPENKYAQGDYEAS